MYRVKYSWSRNVKRTMACPQHRGAQTSKKKRIRIRAAHTPLPFLVPRAKQSTVTAHAIWFRVSQSSVHTGNTRNIMTVIISRQFHFELCRNAARNSDSIRSKDSVRVAINVALWYSFSMAMLRTFFRNIHFYEFAKMKSEMCPANTSPKNPKHRLKIN